MSLSEKSELPMNPRNQPEIQEMQSRGRKHRATQQHDGLWLIDDLLQPIAFWVATPSTVRQGQREHEIDNDWACDDKTGNDETKLQARQVSTFEPRFFKSISLLFGVSQKPGESTGARVVCTFAAGERAGCALAMVVPDLILRKETAR